MPKISTDTGFQGFLFMSALHPATLTALLLPEPKLRHHAHQTESPQFQVLRGCGDGLGESRGARWSQQLRQSHRPASLGPVNHRPATLAGEAVGAPEPGPQTAWGHHQPPGPAHHSPPPGQSALARSANPFNQPQRRRQTGDPEYSH